MAKVGKQFSASYSWTDHSVQWIADSAILLMASTHGVLLYCRGLLLCARACCGRFGTGGCKLAAVDKICLFTGMNSCTNVYTTTSDHKQRAPRTISGCDMVEYTLTAVDLHAQVFIGSFNRVWISGYGISAVQARQVAHRLGLQS